MTQTHNVQSELCFTLARTRHNPLRNSTVNSNTRNTHILQHFADECVYYRYYYLRSRAPDDGGRCLVRQRRMTQPQGPEVEAQPAGENLGEGQRVAVVKEGRGHVDDLFSIFLWSRSFNIVRICIYMYNGLGVYF